MDPDLLGGGDLSFRTITSSPLNKLSCFSINRLILLLSLLSPYHQFIIQYYGSHYT